MMLDPQKMIAEIRSKSMTELSDQLQNMLERRTQPLFKIPVFGGMKAGKSTLLAKLLECDQAFLPPDVLEATGKNVTIKYSFAADRLLAKKDGTEEFCDSDEEWNLLVRGKKGVPVGTKLVLELPSEYLKNNHIVFVDTPGNNTTDNSKIDETWSALEDCSLGIYCLRASEVMTKSDFQFLLAASHYVNSFVFVITRIDEIGASSFECEQARMICEHALSKLDELKIKPLALLAVSSVFDPRQSGMEQLKSKLEYLLSEQGKDIKTKAFLKDFQRLGQKEMDALRNEKRLREKALSESRDVLSEKIAGLQSKVFDSELAKKTAKRKLSISFEQTKSEIISAVNAAGKSALMRLEERLQNIKTGKDIEEGGKAILYSEIDAWRTEIKNRVMSLADEKDRILADAAAEFLNEAQETISGSLDIPFHVNLEEVNSEELVPFEEIMKQLENEKESLKTQIRDLEEEIGAGDNLIPDLQSQLKAIQNEMNQLEYSPVMREKVCGQINGNAAETLGYVGSAIDYALMLSPIPMEKLKWLSKLKYGKQIRNVIKVANKVIRAKNRLIKRTGSVVPGFEKFCESLSVEYLGEKLGEAIDNRGKWTRMVEDPEVKAEYLKTIAPYKEKADSIKEQIVRRECAMRQKELQLKEIENHVSSNDKAYQAVNAEYMKTKELLRQEKDRERFNMGIQQIMETACILFRDPESVILAPMRERINIMLADYLSKLQAELDASMDATIQTIKDQIDSFRSKITVSEETQKRKIRELEEQIGCLAGFLTQLAES
jgi:GTPase Era involved in 16S rRNA processing